MCSFDLEKRRKNNGPPDGAERRVANGDQSWRRVWDVIANLLITLATAGVLYLVASDRNQAIAIASIEASRFTAADGLEVWRELATKANASDVPPREVLVFMQQTNEALQNLNDKIDRHIEGQ